MANRANGAPAPAPATGFATAFAGRALRAVAVIALVATAAGAFAAPARAWAAVTVAAADLDVTVGEAVYSGAEQMPVAVSYAGQALIEGLDYRIVLDEGFGDTVNAGTVKGRIEAAAAVDPDGFSVQGSRSFSFRIEPCTVTVAAVNGGKQFGQAEPPLQTSLEYDQVHADGAPWVPAFTVSRAAGEAAGSYAVSVSGPASSPDGNYRVQYRSGTFLISAAGANEVYVANASALAKTYDGKSVTVQGAATASGSVVWYAVDGGAWTRTAPSFTDAGAHKVRLKATNDNYEDTGSLVTEVTIAKRAATIAVSSASKRAGQKDPAFTGKVTGLAAAGDLGTVSYYRSNTAEKAGTYRDVLSARYTANKNYTVQVTRGTFAIKAAAASSSGSDAAASSGSAASSGAAGTASSAGAASSGAGSPSPRAAADAAEGDEPGQNGAAGTPAQGAEPGAPTEGTESEGDASDPSSTLAADGPAEPLEEVVDETETPQAAAPESGEHPRTLLFAVASLVFLGAAVAAWLVRRRKGVRE